MKRIYKYYGLSCFMIALLLFLFLAVLSSQNILSDYKDRLSDMLVQVERKYIQTQKASDDKILLLKKDYINRAQTVRFLLLNDEVYQNEAGMRKLKNLMHVDKINVIDHKGIICLSDNPQAVGTDLSKRPEAEQLYQMAIGENKEKEYSALGKYDEDGERKADHIIIRMEEGPYSVMEITFYSSEVDEAIKNARIDNVVRNFLTEQDTTAVALDKKGRIIGISENNQQKMLIKGIDGMDARIKYLREAKNGKISVINHRYSYAMAKEYADFYLCVYYDLNEMTTPFFLYMLGMAVVILGVIVAMMLFLHGFFNKYLLEDYRHMRDDIHAFVNGDYDRNIRDCKNEELKELNQAIRQMREGYRHKNERMNKIIGSLDVNVAAFECLEYTKNVFLSDNARDILGLTDREVAQVKASVNNFQLFMDSIQRNKDENNVCRFNGHWLKIESNRRENEFFGLIIDKTEEYEKRQQMEDELLQAQNKSRRDSLTGLYNREGFRYKVEEYLSDEPEPEGIMLIIDLDNFKKINDNLGHPEGDRALKIMAECLKKEFRRSDIAARIGGDEFVVFIPNYMDRQILLNKLNNLLDSVRSGYEIYKEYGVSISIGVAFYNELLNSYGMLYEASDTALYTAKALGKNQFYINDDNIRCMEDSCMNCRKDCSRKKILGL